MTVNELLSSVDVQGQHIFIKEWSDEKEDFIYSATRYQADKAMLDRKIRSLYPDCDCNIIIEVEPLEED